MQPVPRHQCIVYDGSPAKILPALANHMREKLNANFRCLYLNSPAMVAGIRSYLYAAGVDVSDSVASGRLILSAEQSPLMHGHFDMERMLTKLEAAVNSAVSDGYKGLWATGDMSWEMGPDRNLQTLLEYEWRLEQLFAKHGGLSGICQYHADTLPRDLVCHSILIHPAVFINDTLSRINPKYIPSDAPLQPAAPTKELLLTVKNLCSLQPDQYGPSNQA